MTNTLQSIEKIPLGTQWWSMFTEMCWSRLHLVTWDKLGVARRCAGTRIGK